MATVALWPSPASSQPLSVLTYNVHGLPPLLIGDRSGKVEAIAELLESLRTPDTSSAGARIIVALQEVFDRDYHRTLVGISASSFPFATVKNRGGTFGLGDGLVQLSVSAFARPFRVDWKKCFGRLGLYESDCDTDKGFSYARHAIAPGAFVDVYNLHADAGGDRGSFAARRSNIRQLLKAMQLLSPPGTAVIVMGDTNARYTRSPRDNVDQLLVAGGLRDVWVELVRGGRVPEPGPMMDVTCSRAPAGRDCELVDKIFYRSGSAVSFAPVKYEVLENFRDKRGRELSDHYPVAARFDVKVRSGLAESG
ncbi:MAG TPA: endonuclease/exonuclease/phosphatase family protein [Candidatus Limnocylindrales bacterium]|nr:endonuclease/exonuclease/phosphatase family protein [Candidatus Limnocylindrales bacterium]